MRTWGGLLITIGLLMTLVAFSLDTSVSSFDGGAVNNLGLMQRQMMVLHTGLAAFIAGTVLVVGSVAQLGSSVAISETTVVRPQETDEEREERLAGVRQLNRTIGYSLSGLLILIIAVVIIMSLR